MAERFLFFNSAPADKRSYQAQDFAEYFGSVLSTGLLHTDNMPGMMAEVDAGTLHTIVSPGKAIMKGHLYENTTPLTLEHALPETSLDRIDRIVLRLNLNNAVRDIKLHVISGVPAAVPAAPALTRTPFVYEISLAQVLVRQNTVQLLPGDLTDERMDEELCGLTYSLISIPTNQLIAEFRAWQQNFQNDQTANFQEWITYLETVLDDNTAGNLLNKIEKNATDIQSLTKIVRSHKILTTGWQAFEGIYKYEIADVAFTADTIVDVNLHRASLPYASGLLGTTETTLGKCTLFARAIPSADLTCDYVAIRDVI